MSQIPICSNPPIERLMLMARLWVRDRHSDRARAATSRAKHRKRERERDRKERPRERDQVTREEKKKVQAWICSLIIMD